MAQTPKTPPVVSVQTLSSGSLNVCGDSIVFTLNITNTATTADSVASNIYIQVQMQNGLEYESGSVSGSGITYATSTSGYSTTRNSTPNTPIFKFTGTLASLASTSFTFRARANCKLIPFLQSVTSIQPVGITNTTDVIFTMKTAGFYNSESYGSESYNVGYGALQTLLETADKNIVAARGDAIVRTVKLLNTGVGYIKDSVIGGNGVTMKIRYPSAINVTKVCLGSSTTALPHTASGDTLIFHITNFSSIGDFDHYFEIGDTLLLKEYIAPNTCALSITTDYKAEWGCDSRICNNGDNNALNSAFINVSGLPAVVASLIQMPTTDLCGTNVKGIFKFTNNGNGHSPARADGAYGFALQVDNFNSYGLGDGGKIENAAIKDSTGGYTYLTALGASTGDYSLDNLSGLYHFDIDGTGVGLADLDGDGYFDDLPSGKDVTFRLDNNYTCPGNNYTRDLRVYSSQISSCGSYSQSNTLRYQSSLVAGASSITGSTDVRDKDEVDPNNYGEFTLAVNSTRLNNDGLEVCGTGTFTSYLHLPEGYTIQQLNWNGSPVSYTYSGDSVIVNGGGFNGSYDIILLLDCTADIPQTATMNWKMFYQCGSCTTCNQWLVDSKSYTWYNHCTMCEGIHTDAFAIVRKTLGKVKPSAGYYTWGDYKSAAKVNPATSGLRLDAGMQYDTLQAIAKGIVYGGGSFDNAHVKLDYTYALSSDPLTYLNAYAIISGGATCALSAPTYSGSSGSYTYDFDLTPCLSGGIIDSNSTIDLYANYSVKSTSSLSRGEYPINFRAEHYAFDAFDERSACENFGDQFTILKAQVFTSSIQDIDNCSDHYNAWSTVYRYPPLDGKETFPLEFRLLTHIESLTADVPAGFHYVTGASYQLGGYFAFPSINDPTITTISGGRQHLSYPLSDDRVVTDFYNTSFLAEGLLFKIAPDCDTSHMPASPVMHTDFTYTLNDYTYNSSLIDHISATDYNFLSAGGNQRVPNLSISADATQEAYSKTVTWPVVISNTADSRTNANSSNTWLKFAPHLDNIILVSAKDQFGTPYTFTGLSSDTTIKLIQVGTVPLNGSKTIYLTAIYTTCAENTLDSIDVSGGFSCTGYPSSTADFSCQTLLHKKLYIRYKLSILQPSIIRRALSYNLCQPVPFEVNLTAAGFADLDDLKLWIKTPAGITMNVSSGYYTFPATASGLTAIGTNASAQGSGYTAGLGWNLSDALPSILHPFQGSHASGLNSVKIKFDVSASCDYDYGKWGEPIRFFAQATASCGESIVLPFNQYRIRITGTDLDSLALSATGANFTQCGAAVPITLTAVNKGTVASHAGFWEVTLPKTIQYVASSSVPSPLTTTTNADSSVTYTWNMSGGIAVDASASFTFYAQVSSFGIVSGQKIIARTRIPSSALCVSGGMTCTRNVTTGLDSIPAVIMLSVPTLEIISSEDSICAGTTQAFTLNPPGGPLGYTTYDWSINGVPVASHLPSLSYTVDQGVDTIRVMASKAGLCRITDTLVVVGLEVPDVLVVDTLSATSCVGISDGSVTFHRESSAVAISNILLTGPGLGAGLTVTPFETFIDDLSSGFFQFIVTYANGCVSTTSFTIPQGGPSISACVENIGCNTSTTYNSTLHLTVTRVYPIPTGTYHYRILKNSVSYLTGNGVFGVEKTEALTAVTTSDVFKVELIPDVDFNGNICSVTSSDLPVTVPSISVSGPGNLSPCVQGGTVNIPVTVNPGLNSCTVISASYTFQLYTYDSTSTTYVISGSPATSSSATYVLEGLTEGLYRVVATLDKDGYFNCSASYDFQILPSRNVFSILLHKENLRCNSGADGSAFIDVFGGSPPVTYRWYQTSNPSDTLGTGYRITGLSAGISYTVEIHDQNDCQDTSAVQTFTLTEPPALEPITLEATGLCSIKATTAGGGTPGYSVTWIYYDRQQRNRLDSLTNVVITDTIYVQQTPWIDSAPVLTGGVYVSDPLVTNAFTVKTGPYKVILTDANGCQKVDSLYLSKPHVPRTYELCMRYSTVPTFHNSDTTKTTVGPPFDFQPGTFTNEMEAQVNLCKTAAAQQATASFSNKCSDVENIADAMTINYGIHYFQYTLYYYDRAGRLARTVPPKGVHPDYTDRSPQALKHTFVSSYDYNSYGQLITQRSPDADTSRFIYNEAGQLRFSQNARQKIDGTYSYSKYDSLGRVKEVGESELTTTFDALNDVIEGENAVALTSRVPLTSSPLNREQTFTTYSDSVQGINYYGGQNQQYLQNRVSHVYTINKQGARADQYYSYDPHGNVRWLVDDIPGFGKNHVFYEYDLISNKVLRVKFNEFRKDRYFHRYSYDEDNRITQVETSKDTIIWEKDANYKYYAHGPLKRAGIGEDKIQGMDYVYTIHGWLKGLNGPNLIATEDPGRDTTIANVGYATDVFGMTLGYYQGDFTRTGIFNSTSSGKYYLNNGGKNLYNGNISQWQSKNKGSITDAAFIDQLTGELYTYDRLNRIKSSRLNAYSGTSFASQNDFATDYSYDPNGNITSLKRKAYSNILMDDLAYHYNTTDNKLLYVSDNTGASQDGTLNDIKAGQSSGNYVYDASGRLIRDVQSKLTFVWTVSDKLSLVIPDKQTPNQQPSLKFIYDPMGNRIAKEVNEAPYYVGTTFKDTITDLSKIRTTFYVRDASGNVLSIYERTNAYSRDTSFFPCANEPIDSAVYKGIQYCYNGSIPSYSIIDTGLVILDAGHTTIASGDTLILGDTTTYAGNFTLNSGGLLIIKGNYTPSYYTFNSGGRIVIAPGGSLTFPYLYLGSGQTIDNYGTLSLTNAGIAGTINNYGTLNAAGNLSGSSGGTLINYGTLNATGGMEGNASIFTNKGSVYVTGNFSNNGGTVLTEGPMEVSGNFANNTGTVTNKCTIDIGDNLEIDAGLTNLGKITADSTTFVNGGGTLYLQGSSTLETRSMNVYHVIRNDSTACSLLRLTGGDLTEGGGATYVGNVTLCGVTTTTGAVATWSSGTVYTGGQQAVQSGILYEAKWWTMGDDPSTHSGTWDVWINKGTYVPPTPTDPDICDCVPGKVICALVTKSLYVATIKQIEVPLYGSDRLGDYRPNLTVDTLAFFSDSMYVVHIEKSPRSYIFNDTSSEQTVYRLAGDKHYELKDHLGNVRVLVSDVKSPILASGAVTRGEADLLAYYNYYPFGMLQPKRTMNTDESRYAFNGKEKDDEIEGVGNSYDYGYRFYNTRLARFFSVDPLTKDYPELTPYQFASNKPIRYIDIDGLEAGSKKDNTGTTLVEVLTDNDLFEVKTGELLRKGGNSVKNNFFRTVSFFSGGGFRIEGDPGEADIADDKGLRKPKPGAPIITIKLGNVSDAGTALGTTNNTSNPTSKPNPNGTLTQQKNSPDNTFSPSPVLESPKEDEQPKSNSNYTKPYDSKKHVIIETKSKSTGKSTVDTIDATYPKESYIKKRTTN